MPLPLFYALSQAGRAIAAALLPEARWDFRGHGLRVSACRSALGRSTVSPRGKIGTPEARDAVSVVSAATGSPVITTPVEVAALWASTPGLERVEGFGAEHPPALHLEHSAAQDPIRANVRLPEADLPDDEAREALARRFVDYPMASGFELAGRQPSGVQLVWRSEDNLAFRALDIVGHAYLSDMEIYLRPGLGPNRDTPTPLMTWWALLLALSSLARYEPAAWTAALNPDRSRIAVPLATGLRRVRLFMPRMVRHAITGTWDA